ncbi:FkbM family methyltransferase [Actinomycetospora sp. CA-053990]|uniref:FkbM family methyltransferase n=1 Tax=Actinomycetospora sp. CA-053990 TaxID=3239891 RepID=UPI003D938CB8
MARKILAGYDLSLTRLSKSTPARRARFVADAGVTVLVDVGAHVGTYALDARRGGYPGRIESFEPLRDPYEILEARAKDDPLWHCHRLALGDRSGTLTMHVAGNEVSSSALAMLPRHLEGDPRSAYVRSEQVETARLDNVLIPRPSEVLGIKLDVQGYERRVLDGATVALGHAALLELELSLVRLYEGSPLAAEMIQYLAGLGFEPIWFDPAFYDERSGRMLQVDAIFARVS